MKKIYSHALLVLSTTLVSAHKRFKTVTADKRLFCYHELEDNLEVYLEREKSLNKGWKQMTIFMILSQWT
jgi:hypothetical protein